jgi:branched-chain amino acid aminotransferase
MADVAPLAFEWQRAQSIPDKRLADLLAFPGFGDTFSDHRVTVRWTAELGWHDARVGPARHALHPATMALNDGQTVLEGPSGARTVSEPCFDPSTCPAGSPARHAEWPCLGGHPACATG